MEKHCEGNCVAAHHNMSIMGTAGSQHVSAASLAVSSNEFLLNQSFTITLGRGYCMKPVVESNDGVRVKFV